MEVTGNIKMIGETQTFGAKGFQKRELVVTTDEQYPQHILIEFVQDKCAVLDAYKTGESVKVGINLRGREWTNKDGEVKHFNSIQGWRIDKAAGVTVEHPAPTPDFNDMDNDDSGLPF